MVEIEKMKEEKKAQEEEDKEDVPMVPLTLGIPQTRKAYALTPAPVINEQIHYSTAASEKIYKQATKKLKTEQMRVDIHHLPNLLTHAAIREIRIVRQRLTVNNIHHGPLSV